jgi:hypothetical protein
MEKRSLCILLTLALSCLWLAGCYPPWPTPDDDDSSLGDDDDSSVGDDDDSSVGDDDDSSVGDDTDSVISHGWELWFRAGCNLHLHESCQQLMTLMDRAVVAGYTGLHFVAFKDHLIRDGDDIPADEVNLAAVVAKAEELGLDMMKSFGVGGAGEGLLRADPNLAEALPVTATYRVPGSGTALVLDMPDSILSDGSMDDWSADGTQLASWGWTDPGLSRSTDVRPFSQGGYSMRVDLAASGENKRAGVEVDLLPFRQYEVSFWAKTENAAVTAEQFGVHIKAVADSSWRVWIGPGDLAVSATQDWTRYRFTFNSLGDPLFADAGPPGSFNVYVGAWGVSGVQSGTLWLDEVTVKETGLINLIRRPGAPLTVERLLGAVPGPAYEAQDFEVIEDPHLGEANGLAGSYDLWHEPPVITMLGSNWSRGQKVLVHHYAVQRVYSGSVAPSMCSDGVKAVVLRDLQDVLLSYYPNVSSFLLNYDEIRQANWGQDCQDLALDAGQLLASHARQTIEMIRGQVSAARIYAWSDMFDPHHNAIDNYYLVNGSFDNSWVDLDPQVVIINWNGSAASFQHFQTQGLSQLVSGDGASISTRLDGAEGIASIVGAYFVNWSDDFTELESFAETVLERL